jgi:hypothetical protein
MEAPSRPNRRRRFETFGQSQLQDIMIEIIRDLAGFQGFETDILQDEI